MRVALDCTPLLGTLSGVGVYTSRLLEALAAEPGAELVATAFTLRGRGGLAAAVPPAVEVAARPVPARVLRESWSRTSLPPVEWLCGDSDVFHATNFVLPPARRARGVLTVHDLSFLRYPQTVSAASLRYQELVPRGLHRAAAVCTPSAAVADQLLSAYRFPAERVVVTPLGVEPAWFTASAPTADQRRELGLPAEYLLAVGTLEPRKNLQLLLAAYARVLGRSPDAPPLVLVGAAGWGTALDTSGVPANRLVLTGHLPIDRLRGVVAGAVVLAFPSLDEGFGLPPLEALACGVPVVAADIAVTHEVLGDQATYRSPHDVDDFADGLAEALVDPPTSATDRRAHAATFTWEKCAEATRSAYAVALG